LLARVFASVSRQSSNQADDLFQQIYSGTTKRAIALERNGFFTDMSEIITWSNLICWQRSHECATKKTCFSIHGACSPRRNKNMATGELPVEVGQIPRQASLLKLFSM
jgi:hypothetical protein